MTHLHLLPVLLLFLLPLAASAQTPYLRMPEPLQPYQNQEITALMEAADGQLWLGTRRGLLRYNGLETSLFTRADSLQGDEITALGQGSDGTVWVGHRTGSVTTWQGGAFSAFKPQEGTPGKEITRILVTADSAVWLATDSVGLWFYHGEKVFIIDQSNGLLPDRTKEEDLLAKGGMPATSSTGSAAAAETAPAAEDEFEGLLPGLETSDAAQLGELVVEINDLYADSKGRLWVAMDAGITVITNGTDANRQFEYLRQQNGLPENYTIAVGSGQPLSPGAIFMAFRDEGAGLWYPEKKTWAPIAGSKLGILQAALLTAEGTLWLSTQNNGLWRLNPKTGEAVRLNRLQQTATSILQDFQGTLWLGTAAGVYQQPGYRFSFLAEADGLPAGKTFALTQAADGSYWLGGDYGLAQYQAGKPIRQWKTQMPGQRQVASVLDLAQDNAGNMWAGTYGGLVRIDNAGGMRMYTQANGLSSNEIKAVYYDKKANRLLLGTFGGGLTVLALDAAGMPQGRPEVFNSAAGFPEDYIYAVWQDPAGAIWLGGQFSGLIRLKDGKTDTWGPNNGLPTRAVYSISADSLGHLWLGTPDKGVYQFDGKTFTAWTMRDGLRDDAPLAVETGPGGLVVVANRFGLDVIEPARKLVYHYGKESGLEGLDIQLNAIYLDHAGGYWLGTARGAFRYLPASIIPRSMPPRLTLSRLRIFLKDRPMTADMELAYDENHVTFDWTGIYPEAPQNVTYRYRLVGFDEEWSLETPLRYFTYSNLPPGDYTFEVQANNGMGQWSDTTSYKFAIIPPFWRTIWFYILATVLVVGGTVAAVRWRLRQIEKEKAILEQKVQERTEEISHQKAIIEEKNQDILESIQYAQRLQRAILPAEAAMQQAFPNHFVLYRPKDIVSGDFYWMSNDGTRKMVAAVDCTGHGVPGAFMSVMGYNQLNETIVHMPAEAPGRLLTELDKRVRAGLRQDSVDAVTKDGMDVALCVINEEEKSLAFAGAYRSLLLVRNNDATELKGDRYPVGGAQVQTKDFQTQQIQYQAGDIVYMFSDGFVDQFGGPNGRKFTPKRLRDLILENHKLPMAAQRAIYEAALVEWMEGYEQLDDILLIGIRL